MDATELNNPTVRQSILRSRVADGGPLVAAVLATEFGVSIDTIRRDLMALEDSGAVQRVRGGAIPVSTPVAPLSARIGNPNPVAGKLAAAALPLIKDGMVILLDGGTTVTHLARSLPALPHGLIVTPAPSVALASMEKGIETILIGGRLSASGGICVGSDAERALDGIAADLCFMGVCGLEPQFGLSADDFDESALKRRMRASAHHLVGLASAEKLGKRARHRSLGCDEIDRIITNANQGATAVYADTGMIVDNV